MVIHSQPAKTAHTLYHDPLPAACGCSSRTSLDVLRPQRLYGNHVRKNSSKREVNKPRIKIGYSSASEEADPYSWSDHVGGRDAGRGKIWGGGVFVAHLACWEEILLDGNTWPGFLFPGLVDIARGGGVQNNGAPPVALVLRCT